MLAQDNHSLLNINPEVFSIVYVVVTVLRETWSLMVAAGVAVEAVQRWGESSLVDPCVWAVS